MNNLLIVSDGLHVCIYIDVVEVRKEQWYLELDVSFSFVMALILFDGLVILFLPFRLNLGLSFGYVVVRMLKGRVCMEGRKEDVWS